MMSMLKSLMKVKMCHNLIGLVISICIFFALINGTQAASIPEMPAKFVPMNIRNLQFENKIDDVECSDGGKCSKQKTKVAVSTLREGVETERRPQVGELYDCSKQKMEGIMQSQNHMFCDTKERQVKSFKAQVYAFKHRSIYFRNLFK